MIFSINKLGADQALSSPAKRLFFSWFLVVGLSGCATVPLQQANSLTSYGNLVPVKSKFVKANYMVLPEDIKLAKTVYIEPTMVSAFAGPSIKKASDRALVANVISRALCVGVSDRFEVVASRENADLVVQATVTRIVPTDANIAGLSTVVSLGASIASVPAVRIPIGLGGLSVEAEATDKAGKQVAALVWANGANFITSNARVSQVGDAYTLAATFGDDFSDMLVTGKSPYEGWLKLPSRQKLFANLGGKPKFNACEKFGRSPFLMDTIASNVGAPPSWTDKTTPELIYTSVPK